MSSDAPSEPSMIAGHAKYVQGAICSALGYETGDQTKKDAVQEMRDAQAATAPDGSRPNQSGILGSIESAAGKAVGCEGMEKEGAARKPGVGSEEASGTG